MPAETMKNLHPKLLNIINSDEYWRKAKYDSDTVCFPLGSDVNNKFIYKYLSDMRSIIALGTSGSELTEFCQSVLLSMVCRYTPDDVLFSVFNKEGKYDKIFESSHHFLLRPISEENKLTQTINFLSIEMEQRSNAFRQVKCYDIVSYNVIANTNNEKKLPYFVVVIDGIDFTEGLSSDLINIIEKGYVFGIYPIITVNSTLKSVCKDLLSKFASAILFDLSDDTEIRVLPDEYREKQLRQGTCIFYDIIGNNFFKVDLPIADERDNTYILDKVSKIDKKTFPNLAFTKLTQDLDPLCNIALEYWSKYNGGRASISSIQRGLAIGFNRAGRIFEQLQKLNVIDNPKEDGNQAVYVRIPTEAIEILFPHRNKQL